MDTDDDITRWGLRRLPVERWLKLRDKSRYGELDPRHRYGDRKRLPQPPSGRTALPGDER
jgi:hypothetical protein